MPIFAFSSLGDLDSTFSSDGIVITDPGGSAIARSISVNEDNSIIISGVRSISASDNFIVVKYLNDGTLDGSFGESGISVLNHLGDQFAVDHSVQSDGKLVMVGGPGNFTGARVNIDGSIDSNFGVDGFINTDFAGWDDGARSIVLDDNQNILVSGYCSLIEGDNDFAVARYDSTGSLDFNFSADGLLTIDMGSTYDYANGIALQSDGKILVAGFSGGDFAVIRLFSEGLIDSSFGINGKSYVDLGSDQDMGWSLAILDDDGIIIAGKTGSGGNNDIIGIAKLTADGFPDESFGESGVVTTDISSGWDIAYSVKVQENNKILVTGGTESESGRDVVLVRYNGNGQPDIDFGQDGIVITDYGSTSDTGNDIALQDDGKILIAGYKYISGNINNIALSRYIGYEYSGPVWHISTNGSDETGDGSEASPFATIQFGIDASQNSDTVLVQPGTYTENINFNGKNIVVGSLLLITDDTTYIQQTVIDAGESANAVEFSNGENNTAVLLGFTILNGATRGIFCENSSPSIRNCIVSQTLSHARRGIWCWTSSPRIDKVVVTGNNEIGIWIGYESHPLITNSTSSYNSNGIHCTQFSNPILIDVILRGNIGDGNPGGGFYAGTGSSPVLKRVTIINNQAGGNGGGGVYIGGSSNATLDSVSITGNSTTVLGGGIRVSGFSTITATRSEINNNSSPNNAGSYLGEPGSAANFTQCTINNGGIYLQGHNEWNTGATFNNSIVWESPIHTEANSDIHVTYSLLQGGEEGVTGDVSGSSFTSVIDDDPLFTDSAAGDLSLTGISPCIDAGNPGSPFDPDGTISDMGAYYYHQYQTYEGPTWHVSTNGSDVTGNGSETFPFLTIQNAVTIAGSGDTVKLAPGEYLENVLFNHDTLTLLGDTAGIAIVNGNNTESCFIIDSSQVDIFNISFTNGSVQTLPKNGSGIRYNESIGKVKGCKLYENNSTAEGSGAGGIGISYSNVDIDSCEIYENSAADIGGGISYIWASGEVTNTKISSNIAYGTDLRGGGGVAIWHSNVSLDHNLIHTNSAARGGGIWIQSISSLDVLNCTITENSASERSGGISQYDWSNSSLDIENSIVWNNNAPANPNYGIGEPNINYSIIQWSLGIGNINNDPLFTDSYNLSENSPAIDSGNPDFNGNGSTWETDIDDQDPDGTRMDMGAYYYHQTQLYTGPTWHVSTEGSDTEGNGSIQFPFASIQTGLDRANESDSIIVSQGTYSENLIWRDTPGLKLFGENPITTIVDGGAVGSVLSFDVGLSGLIDSGTKIENLTLRNGNATEGGGIYCVSSNDGSISPILSNLIIENNHATWHGGGAYLEESDFTIQGCIFQENTAGQNGGGAYLRDYDGEILDSKFISNSAQMGGGLSFRNLNWHTYPLITRTVFDGNTTVGIYQRGANPVYTNVTISNNAGSGILIADHLNLSFINSIVWGNESDQVAFEAAANSCSVTISYSDIQGGETGINLPNDAIVNWLEGNIESNPEFDVDGPGYTLSPESPCIDTGDPSSQLDPDGTRSDMGAYYFYQVPAYVGPVWHVSTEGSDETGDGSQETPFASIQAGINTSQSGDTVLVQPGNYIENINYSGKNIVVGSLTLTTRDTSFISQTIIDGNQSGSVVTITNGEDSTAVLSGFTITNGFAVNGGGIYIDGGSLFISHNRITDNIATNWGGGLSLNHDGQTKIADCLIDSNSAVWGGGIFCANNSITQISDVIFRGNMATSTGGAFYCSQASPTIDRVLVEGNSAIAGGGMYFFGTSYTETFLNNLTIVNNEGTAGLLAQNQETILRVNNCIIWGNLPVQISDDLGTTSINYSNIQNGWEGVGNLDEDPLFIDPENSNYHLSIASPCIDSGNPIFAHDPDGTVSDMGAYYFDQSSYFPQISISPPLMSFTVNTTESFEQSQTLTISNTGGAPLLVAISADSTMVTDLDGNIYSTIQIGDQIWMAENLKVTHYRDGSEIPNVTSADDWRALTSGAYCISDNNNTSGIFDTYGALYNWSAATDTRNISPVGWHIPSDDEWKELEITLGMSQSEADDTGYRGTNQGSKLAGNRSLWANGLLEDESEFGTSGFDALPGGRRTTFTGYDEYLSIIAEFWSATEYNSGQAWKRNLITYRTDITREVALKNHGLSIRCVKDLTIYAADNSEQRQIYHKSREPVIQNGGDRNAEPLMDSHENWLTTTPTILTILPAESAEVTVTVTADGLELGDYSDVITITSNDLLNARIEVPVLANVFFQDLTAPDINLNTPDFSEVVQNGDTLAVTWTASDNVGLDWAKLFFTTNGGESYSLHDSVDANLSEVDWIAPNIISDDCGFLLWVSDFAGNVSADTLSESFAIQDGTLPLISIQNPNLTTSIREQDSLHVSWIASDNIGIEHFGVWFSNHPEEPLAYLVEIASQDTIFSFVIGEGVSDSAQIKMAVMDISGNMSEDYSDYFSITDNTRPNISHFSIPDTTDWGIGSVMDISVIATDNVEVTGLDLKYSINDSESWSPIVVDLYPVQGRPTYSWLIPDIPGECQIQAVVADGVGLTDTSYSDIFSIFVEYPRMIASLPEIRPNGAMHFAFSQIMDSLDIASGTQVIGSVHGEYEIAGSLNGYDLTISSVDGFISLDTIMVVLTSSAWSNSFGYGLDGNEDGLYSGDNTDNDTSYTVVTAAGDYDQNGVLNFDDFDDFVIAWHSNIAEFELAPHQGEIPFISIQPDSSFDIYDLATFASMWNWAAGISLSAPLTESYQYEEFLSEQAGNELEVSLPLSDFVASQTIIKYDPSVVQIMVADDGLAKVSSSALSMVDVNPDSGFILITSSHLTDSHDEVLKLKLVPDTKQRYSIEIAIQGSDMDANVIQKRTLVELLPIPTSFSLSQNYPNPFNASTTIEYGLPKNSELSISIYDIRGRFVKDIYTGEKQAGYHVTQWNGSNDVGRNVASGLYFIVLHTPEYRVARKALILK
jgi:uncharacterized protein (TIGR02145 family)/uncharacterized delta-60 repeat protein